ncbi:MAG: hypothetical protein L0241_13720, partial [Planctomycetia bacterium]|nr:hypothetical protein [Planctomycetia bacterium]
CEGSTGKDSEKELVGQEGGGQENSGEEDGHSCTGTDEGCRSVTDCRTVIPANSVCRRTGPTWEK